MNSNLNNGRKLLWTNSNPSAEYLSQTITLSDNLSNYAFYEIYYRNVHNSNYCGFVKALSDCGMRLPLSDNCIGYRDVINNGNTLNVGICKIFPTYNSSTYQEYKHFIIPVAVYGIK